MPPTNAVHIGLLAGGATREMIMMHPENNPAAPTPATALPTMRVAELGATPHINDPTSNIVKATKYVHLMDTKPYNLP